MPRTNPDSSFEVAVKHLFRHLHEPAFLRRNPLVRHFFATTPAGRPARARDLAALKAIHTLVREGADRYRDAGIAAVDHENALRQHAIVVLAYLDRRPLREVADLLGISQDHCYRARADICRYIARYIQDCHERSRSAAPVPVFDAFRFRMQQAALQAEIGNVEEALTAYESLAGEAAPVQKKVAALCSAAQLLVDSGEASRAANLHARAQQLFQDAAPSLPPAVAGRIEANIQFITACLEYAGARYAQAFNTFQSVDSRLEALGPSPEEPDDLRAKVLAELGASEYLCGNMGRAIDLYAKAEAELDQLRVPSPILRLDLRLRRALYRSRLAIDLAHWQPAVQRLETLTRIFEEAQEFGYVRLSIQAAIALMECYCYARPGNDTAVLDASRFALSLATRYDNQDLLVSTALNSAYVFLHTAHWRYVPALVRQVKDLQCAAHLRPRIRYIEADHALLSGLYQRAWDLASSLGDDGEPLGQDVSVRNSLVAANAAAALHRRRDAKSWIERAIARAEELGSAPLLCEAYGTATTITGEVRFRRKAQETAKILTT